MSRESVWSDGARSAPPFPPPLAALVREIGRAHSADRGRVLFRAGEVARGLHVVEDGSVRVLRLSPTGRSVVVHRERVGGILGELPLFDGGPYPATAEVAEPSCIIFLPRLPLLRRVAQDDTLARFFLTRLARRLRDVIERLDGIATRSVAQRLARHLLGRISLRDPARVSLGMRQAELAGELGTTREVVVRELRGLCARHVLRAQGAGRFDIADVEALRALAE